jgi:hypothetical protein
MNVPTIKMDKHEARRLYLQYRSAPRKNREDMRIQRGYHALSKGKTLIDVRAALEFAGVDEKGWPKLAIVRADATRCTYAKYGDEAQYAMRGAPRNAPNSFLRFPLPSFPYPKTRNYSALEAIVPIIPPHLRPEPAQLPTHFILWEAKWAEVMPVDPMLLKHRYGFIYEVRAAWDLTELERLVMAQTRLRNQ